MGRLTLGALVCGSCLGLACGDDGDGGTTRADASAQWQSSDDAGGGDANPAPEADASSATDAANGSGGSCATLPEAAVVDPASMCSSDSGKWTQYTVSITDAGTNAFKQCNLDASALYADQAAFDASEGTSTAPGINITSNGDYVRTDTCASGSIEYENRGQETSFVFIWELEP